MDIDGAAVLASKTFLTEDQERFARLSGDYNPLHMDPIAARRTQAGAPIVHGMHVVLWCLDVVARQAFCPPHPRALKVRFVKPIYVGDTASIRLVRRAADEISLRAEVAGISVVIVSLSFADRMAPMTNAHPHPLDDNEWELNRTPRELRLEEIAGRAGGGRCFETESDLAHRFPAAAAWLEPVRLLGLAALSYLVGMECPGLHSIFATLAVDFVTMYTSPRINYAVTSVDERFRLMRMRVEGAGLAGTVEAFVRRPPVRQMTIEAVAGHVSATEFVGQRVLIIGGSRGLGELTAKVIGAGGGHPIITYASGFADAEEVGREIIDFGVTCEVLRYDVTQPAGPQLAALESRPTQLYYFATSHIFRRKSEVFEVDLLREFLAIYVSGFYNLCTAIASNSPLAIFYPSSLAVEHRPRDLTEYAMAKAAGEVLCADIARFMPGKHVIVKRLPRLLTDQTSTLSLVETASAIDILLPITREVQGR